MRAALRSRTGGGLNKVSIQMTDEDLAKLDDIAREEGLSRSAMVARLMDRGYEGRAEDARMADEIRSRRNFGN